MVLIIKHYNSLCRMKKMCVLYHKAKKENLAMTRSQQKVRQELPDHLLWNAYDSAKICLFLLLPVIICEIIFHDNIPLSIPTLFNFQHMNVKDFKYMYILFIRKICKKATYSYFKCQNHFLFLFCLPGPVLQCTYCT